MNGELLFLKETIGTFNYGIIPAEAVGALGAIVLCYLITQRGEEVRVLFLPMLFIVQIIGFSIGLISIGFGAWFYVTTVLNLNTYGESLTLLSQSNKKRRKIDILGMATHGMRKSHQQHYQKQGKYEDWSPNYYLEKATKKLIPKVK